MEPTRQIFAPRRLVGALGLSLLVTLSACSTVDDTFHRLQTQLNELGQKPSEPLPAPEITPRTEPEPSPPQAATVEEMKPPAQLPRMASKSPPTPKPRPARPGVPNEQAAPKGPAPRIAPADLIGSDFAEVLRLIRQPDTVQTNALAIVWTYSEPVCKLQLFFYPDIETTTFHVLKYDLRDAAGGKLENAGLCMQRILVAKNDAAPSP